MSKEFPNQDNIFEKRFELTTNQDARYQFDNFRDKVKEFQKDYPEVLGATVYGSMIKGDQANENSDIDAFLYIDAEAISDEDKLQNLSTKEYRSNFLKALNLSEEEESKYYRDLRFRMLSNEVLDDYINKYIEYEEQRKVYKKIIEEKYSHEMPNEERNDLLPEKPFKPIDFGISGIFHARVGSGIEKYRRLLLEKIIAIPDVEIAKKIWNNIYLDLITYEGRDDPDKSIRIPSTLNEALALYHQNLYKSISGNESDEKIVDQE